MNAGILYVIATPIGSVDDLTTRAAKTLASVDLIAAEDTRKTLKLLGTLGIEKPLWSLYDHNEEKQLLPLLEKLRLGKKIGLVSDAGTPLISDPGFTLVRAAHQAGIQVVPLPGACAAITALSASGLPCDRFQFIGFLPRKRGERRSVLSTLVTTPHTLIFYESPHRIDKTVEDIAALFGENRPCVLARELTKTHEQIVHSTAGALLKAFEQGSIPLLGEIVLLLGGNTDKSFEQAEALHILRLLQAELPLSKAVQLASKITGVAKNWLYEQGLLSS